MNHPPSPHNRQQRWSMLLERGAKGSPGWDILVVGGGITGAGILREAASRGLSAAMIEQRDFAWGTSSRSSKMIHGGLRYLLTGDVKLVRASVKERDRLLMEAPGLIDPMGFLFSHYRKRFPGRRSFGGLLSLYDLFSRKSKHRYYPRTDFLFLAPHIDTNGLKGGTRYADGVTDDARLVLRTIQDAAWHGALALNYAAAEGLLTAADRVVGISVKDEIEGNTAEIFARVVINATGVWAAQFDAQGAQGPTIRPLRGSHLVFPFWRIPVAQAIAFRHPADSRPVFVFPWEGVTVAGTTDLDHEDGLDGEPHISSGEVRYLLEMIDFQFPSLRIGPEDVLSAYSGIRPVIKGGKSNPSKEKRDHTIWAGKGLISVSGGKLTTFRLIADEVLRLAAPLVSYPATADRKAPPSHGAVMNTGSYVRLNSHLTRRLKGRYGRAAENIASCAKAGELEAIPGTDTLWAELRWTARTEAVVRLEDLLLRRTRIGVLIEGGGSAHFDRIGRVCQEELHWGHDRWQTELAAYRKLIEESYSLSRASRPIGPDRMVP